MTGCELSFPLAKNPLCYRSLTSRVTCSHGLVFSLKDALVLVPHAQLNYSKPPFQCKCCTSVCKQLEASLLLAGLLPPGSPSDCERTCSSVFAGESARVCLGARPPGRSAAGSFLHVHLCCALFSTCPPLPRGDLHYLPRYTRLLRYTGSRRRGRLGGER